MHVSDFDYELPQHLIAQHPPAERGAARMLVLHRRNGACELRSFRDFPNYLRPGDCLVLNDTRVIPARLFGTRVPSGGRVEILLTRNLAPDRWLALMKPGRRLHPGDAVRIDQAPDNVAIVQTRTAEGAFELLFRGPDAPDIALKAGHMPLPPYIHRPATNSDAERYQTVYARRPGAVAAPTAGLPFTREILERIPDAGVAIAPVTLHVGPGTFRPVKTERVEDHVMHEEIFALDPENAEKIRRTRTAGGRVIAVGTTSVRVLETCADPNAPGGIRAGNGTTRLFLHPPKKPRITDALLTNFHLPKSTLLMLVCTFADTATVLAAYRLAVRAQFRFYSYGDCMLLI